ncbi:D-cysteine desulfhydrase family protein [Chloroflexota bacterium]
MVVLNIKERVLITSITKLPRIALGNFPTPLVDASNLSATLDGPHILIKRDDLTGLAFGGNKCRKLEFVMAEAQQKRIDTLITTGGTQSNFAIQMAIAARKLEMEAYLVLFKGVHVEKQGNLLLNNIVNSNIRLFETSDISKDTRSPDQDVFGSDMMAKLNTISEELRKKGRKPMIIPAGAYNPVGTTGWVDAVDEIWQQLQAQKIDAKYLVVASGSSGTQAGLTLGVKYLKLPIKVIGFSVSSNKERTIGRVVSMANETAKFLGMDVVVTPEDVIAYDDYIGEGYGIITDCCLRAIKLVAKTEGIFLDPVYTGKSMAGLIDLIEKGYFKASDNIVFIHTGGVAALFAYHREITKGLVVN